MEGLESFWAFRNNKWHSAQIDDGPYAVVVVEGLESFWAFRKDERRSTQTDCSRRSRELLPVGLSERRWVLQDLHHLDAPHGLALVMIYAHKGANVRKNILKGVCELEGDNVAKTVLDINVRENILKGICELEGVNVAKMVLDINVCKNILKGVRELEGVDIAKTVLDINVCKNILKGIRELEGVDIAKMVLDMCNNDKLCRVKDFST